MNSFDASMNFAVQRSAPEGAAGQPAVPVRTAGSYTWLARGRRGRSSRKNTGRPKFSRVSMRSSWIEAGPEGERRRGLVYHFRTGRRERCWVFPAPSMEAEMLSDQEPGSVRRIGNEWVFIPAYVTRIRKPSVDATASGEASDLAGEPRPADGRGTGDAGLSGQGRAPGAGEPPPAEPAGLVRLLGGVARETVVGRHAFIGARGRCVRRACGLVCVNDVRGCPHWRVGSVCGHPAPAAQDFEALL